MAHLPRVLGLGLAAAFAASIALAQTTPPAAKQGASPRITTKRGSAASSASARVVKPDPDILDGSQFEPEKKPMYGMISEIELAGSEQKSERVGGSNQPPPPAGAQTPPTGQMPGGAGEPGGIPPPPEQPPGGAPGAEIEEKQDDREGGGPQGEAQGVQVKNLETPEGAASQQSAPATAPRDMQIGDATLQIQTVQQKPDTVGQQSTSTQQSDKKMPQGKQTDNRNRGAEKGRVMPKGL